MKNFVKSSVMAGIIRYLTKKNPFLTIPKKILCFLVIFAGSAFIKTLLIYLQISGNQLNEALNRLANKEFVMRERHGRETKINITANGNYYLRNYLTYMEDQIQEFLQFHKSFTKNQFFNKNNKKECIFDALNNNPSLKNTELFKIFPQISRSVIYYYHSKWIDLQIKKFNLKINGGEY